MTSSTSSPARRAFLYSFAVPVLPLLGASGPAWLYGASVLRGALGRDFPQPASWTAADLALLVALQLAFFALLRRAFAEPSRARALAAGGGLVLAALAANLVHARALPARFLEPPDTADENLAWIPLCTLEDAVLAPARSPADGALAFARQAWVLRGESREPWLMDADGCALTELGAPPEGEVGLRWVVPDGASLTSVVAAGEDEPRWWWQPGPKAGRLEVFPPPDVSGVDGPPALSTDGTWVAWIRRPASGAPELTLRHVHSSDERAIPLRAAGAGGLELLAVDLDANRILLARNQQEYLAIGIDGGLRFGPQRFKELAPLAGTFRMAGRDGWIAWDGYREREPYRVEWALQFGRGRWEALPGRRIVSAAVDPGGLYVAVSLTSDVSFGRARDAVVVLRVDDGLESYRRYLPRGTRAEVAFVAPGALAFTSRGTAGSTVEVAVSPDD